MLRAIDSGDWKKETINEEEFRRLLREKIESVKMNFVKYFIPFYTHYACDKGVNLLL
ncbi:hypothetical protein HDC92_000177 [Pedobacter sp. AK017]|uniref:hypothetical protein n=1 Tax=Pedobacter sp. AK017 TaxID=2723073 RepID=UPI0017CDA54F|nr:hypothetical protein [Pedobacter sp. AK017]MBB5436513.1 hypothetical protein [Pedobacter sp. AK017]